VGGTPVLELDGENDYVEVNQLGNMNAITFSAWVKSHDSHGALNTRPWVFGPHTSWGELSMYLRLGSNEEGNAVAWNVNGGYTRQGTIEEKEWMYLAGTYNKNSGEGYLYIGGEEVGSFTASGEVVPDYKTLLASTSQGYDNLNGKIGDVRIYNRALSKSEIQNLYNGKHISDGLVGYWPLNEGKGDTAYGHSGNESHGTLEGDPQWVIGR